MTPKVKNLYKLALKNSSFLDAIYSAEGDKKPGLFACDIEKSVFASIYYGWLVGAHGDDWEQNS